MHGVRRNGPDGEFRRLERRGRRAPPSRPELGTPLPAVPRPAFAATSVKLDASLASFGPSGRGRGRRPRPRSRQVSRRLWSGGPGVAGRVALSCES
jgi:hypothetical protein